MYVMSVIKHFIQRMSINEWGWNCTFYPEAAKKVIFLVTGPLSGGGGFKGKRRQESQNQFQTLNKKF